MTDPFDRPGSAAANDAGTVYLHIGTFKSGTSYLQSVLDRNQHALRDEGILFPTGGRHWGAQVRGVRDVLGMKSPRPSDGAWQDLVGEIHSAPDTRAVISMEFLSLASDEAVQRIVADLRPKRVEVILGARDLVRVLPSAWQSMIKQGHGWPFGEFVAAVSTSQETEGDAHRRFWRHHDLGAIIDRWAAVVGADHVHLLTVPPSGASPTLLWERFCSIIGADPSRYDASQDQGSNFSLSLSDSELMRRLNVELRPELNKANFKKWATHFFANNVLRASSADEVAQDRARLDAATYSWARDRSVEIADAVRTRGVDVVGDVDELVPPPMDPTKVPQENTPRVNYPDEAVVIIAKLVTRLATLDPEAGGGRRKGRGDRTGDSAPRRGAGEERGPRGRRRAGAAEGGSTDHLDEADTAEWNDELEYQ